MREEKWNEEMNQEISVLHEAFDHMQELGLVGGVLRRDGQIVAFSIGERLNSETFVVHFEKAYPDLQGAYPMINQQFVLHECEGYAYVNREEDTGDPGLRKAKLSYYPDILLPKIRTGGERGGLCGPRAGCAVYSGNLAEMFWRRGRLYSVLSEAPHDEREYARDFPGWKTGIDGKFSAGAVPVQRGVCGRALCVCGCDTAGIPGTEACGTDSAFCGRKIQMPLILSPAEESLTRYYENLGFKNAFRGERKNVSGSDITALEVKDTEPVACTEPVTPEEYVRIRDEKCAKEGYVHWDADAVSYAMELAAKLRRRYGGSQLRG